MKCNNCQSELPEKGIFCPKCGNQSKCKSCNELLEKDAIACIYCGEKLQKENSQSSNLNSIEYKETRDDRTFKASFTDSIGENISQAFASFLTNKFTPKAPESTKLIGQVEEFAEFEVEQAEDVPEQKNNESQITNTKTITSNLQKLFKKRNGIWLLNEPRLKASSATDYGTRLTLLLLAFLEEIGEEISRTDLTKVLIKASVNTGNVRTYLGKNSDFTKEDNILHLTLPGKEKAKKFLEEVFDDSVENKWDVSLGKNNNPTRKAIAHKTVDLGLDENERLQFREFANEKSPKIQNDLILTVMYWLKENKGKESLSMDEIHTGIQIIGKTTPKALDTVLRNTKRDHKLDALEGDLFKINKIGTDYVKLQLPKVKKN